MENQQSHIYVHGFTAQKQGVLDDGWEVWRKLHDTGYPGDGISCIWPAGDSWNEWVGANLSAISTGTDLADWLIQHGFVQNNGIEVNLVCHSLGAMVGLECLHRLQQKDLYINTVHFLGGAVHDKVVGDYRHQIYWGCNWLHN